MCLVKTISRDNWMNDKLPKVKIAQREIKVYKALQVIPHRFYPTYESPFRDFEYKEVYHYSEDSLEVQKTTFGWNEATQYVAKVEKGLYAYTSLKWAKAEWECCPDMIFVEMYIPKGAEYLRGDEPQIVSTELIWYKGAKIHHI